MTAPVREIPDEALQRSLHAAVDALRQARSVAVVAHRDPDGDTIGAALVLGLALEGAAKVVSLHCADPVPDAFRFIASTARFRSDPPGPDRDLVVTVDFGDAARAKFDLPQGVRVLNIDHHATNASFGDVNLVDVTSPATAELVARVIDAAGWPWTPEMATAALLGLMTDTGSFQFPSTTPDAHRRAAWLIEEGGDLVAITANVFRARTYPAFKLFGAAFSRLERELDGKLVHTYVTADDFRAAGAAPVDASGLVEQVARCVGMRVAILFSAEKEAARPRRDRVAARLLGEALPQGQGPLSAKRSRPSFETPGAVKISIRTSPYPPAVDAAALAARFGGGGHVRAAGAMVEGELARVRGEVLAAARAALA